MFLQLILKRKSKHTHSHLLAFVCLLASLLGVRDSLMPGVCKQERCWICIGLTHACSSHFHVLCVFVCGADWENNIDEKPSTVVSGCETQAARLPLAGEKRFLISEGQIVSANKCLSLFPFQLKKNHNYKTYIQIIPKRQPQTDCLSLSGCHRKHEKVATGQMLVSDVCSCKIIYNVCSLCVCVCVSGCVQKLPCGSPNSKPDTVIKPASN